jgi:opacity protein-like surface antigen
MRKFSGVLCFVLFVFIFTNSAQTIEKSRETIFSAEDKSESSFSERRSLKILFDKKITKREDTDKPVSYKLKRGGKELNFEFGYSPFEPTHFTGEKEYNTAGRKLGIFAFRYGRVIGTKADITWEYMFEVMPFLFSLKNEVTNPAYISEIETPNVPETKRETSYGFGLTPAAFRIYFLADRRLKPYLQFGMGFIITNKPTPLPETSWFNFTPYWGGGVMYQIKPDRAVTFSYRYFHISNASITRNNPGYNANVFALGYSFFYK